MEIVLNAFLKGTGLKVVRGGSGEAGVVTYTDNASGHIHVGVVGFGYEENMRKAMDTLVDKLIEADCELGYVDEYMVALLG
jgi:hypothetical protein